MATTPPTADAFATSGQALNRRLRNLQLLQLMLLLAVGVGMIVVTLVFGQRVAAANAREDARAKEFRQLSDARDRFRLLGTRYWANRAQGKNPVEPRMVLDFIATNATVRRLAQVDTEHTGDAERAARARAIAQLDRLQAMVGRRAARNDDVMAQVPRTEGLVNAWVDLNEAGAVTARRQAVSDAQAYRRVLIATAIALVLAAFALWLFIERARARALAAAEAVERRFAALVQSSSDMVLVVAPTGRITFASPACERLLGRAPEQFAGTGFSDHVHPDDVAVALALMAARTAVSSGDPVTVRLRHADGSWRWTEIVATDRSADPSVGGVVLNTRDVSDRRAVEDELAHQAFHDGLTGLANRALFEDRVAHAIERNRREGRPVAMMLLDLDDFKTVNDSLGHAAGDRLIAAVADRLRGALRSGDTAARLGGDEFAVLLETCEGEDDATDVARRLLKAIAEPVTIEGYEMVVHGSLGIAVSPSSEADPDEMLRSADVAMYAAKARGRGGYEVFVPAMQDLALQRLALKADLNHALARDEFFLNYQPIVELGNGAVSGVEALLRWQHPQRGLVGPDEFIPLAEESGLIVPIGRWVLEQACADGRRWLDVAPDPTRFYVSVNVSARQLEDPALAGDVRRALSTADLPPRNLVLEVTESVLVRDPERSVETLRVLRGLGVRIAIDDFGTGYSSLSYLGRLPLDLVKIDRSFVSGVGSAERGNDLAAMIVQLVGVLNFEAVAEGIQDVEQVHDLQRLGCALGQGFYFSRPVPRDSIDALLAAERRERGLGLRVAR